MQGWDKTYCLRFVKADFDEIHFFGDKTKEVGSARQPLVARVLSGAAGPLLRLAHRRAAALPALAALPAQPLLRQSAAHVSSPLTPPPPPPQGGNDYEIFESPDTVGHTVVGPDDTIRQLRELFPSPA